MHRHHHQAFRHLQAAGLLHSGKSAIRCTFPNCTCDSFSASTSQCRLCKGCKHSWVAHALDKLAVNGAYSSLGTHTERITFNAVFDVASLMLYGSQAVPVRLKILLDRLLSRLQQEDVIQVLHTFGWSYEDYARGYIIQDATGRIVDKWTIVDKEEERIVTQQFLRFSETKAIAQDFSAQETRQELSQQPKAAESDIRKFMERNKLATKMQSYNLAMQQALIDPARFMGGMAAAAAAAFSGATPSGSTSVGGSLPAALSSVSGSVPPLSVGTALPLSSFSPRSGVGSPGEIPNPMLSASVGNRHADSPPGSSLRGGSPGSKLSAMGGFGGVSRQQSGPEPFDLRTPRSPEEDRAIYPGLSHSLQGGVSRSGTGTPSVPAPAYPRMSESGHSKPSSTASVDEGVALNLSGKDNSASLGQTNQLKMSPGYLGESSLPLVKGWSYRSPGAAANAGASVSSPVGTSGSDTPTFGSTVYVNSSGKKRVLCTACNKTFCDKGALKIHFSAVHLKEMHRCSIQGCDMMFTSRRSRNRHSANPNPKLHTPHTKKSSRCIVPSGSGGEGRGDGGMLSMSGLAGLPPGFLKSESPPQLAAFMGGVGGGRSLSSGSHHYRQRHQPSAEQQHQLDMDYTVEGDDGEEGIRMDEEHLMMMGMDVVGEGDMEGEGESETVGKRSQSVSFGDMSSSRSKRKRLMPTKFPGRALPSTSGANGLREAADRSSDRRGEEEDYEREHNIDNLTADTHSSNCSSGDVSQGDEGLVVSMKRDFGDDEDDEEENPVDNEDNHDRRDFERRYILNGEGENIDDGDELRETSSGTRGIAPSFYAPKPRTNQSPTSLSGSDRVPSQTNNPSQQSPIQALFSSFNTGMKPNSRNSSFWSKFTESKTENSQKLGDSDATSEPGHALDKSESSTNEKGSGRAPSVFPCTIDGCGASFDTQVSRDRHASDIDAHVDLIAANPGLMVFWDGKRVGQKRNSNGSSSSAAESQGTSTSIEEKPEGGSQLGSRRRQLVEESPGQGNKKEEASGGNPPAQSSSCTFRAATVGSTTAATLT